MELSRIDRVYAHVTVTAKLADGTAATLTGVDCALLPVRTSPTSTTTWTPASYSGGVATVLIAGPDADPTGALAVPTAGGDLWIRSVDNPEVTTAHVDRITVI
ncbi:MAG: hypothetical protein ACXVGF_04895 [Blastococcus sp.]